MRAVTGCLAAALLGGMAPGPSTAQVPRFSASSDLVILSATAVDDRGRPITDLRADELRIFEDGRPQRIEHFSGSASTPARLLLLADASGSMTTTLKTASTRMAALQILAALRPEDEAALAAFDHKYWGVVAFTRDREKIVRALDDLEPFGSTALHDALVRAASDLASHGEARRAVVVITDGVDTSSTLRADDAITRSRALDVPVYAITVVSPLDDPGSDRFVGRRRAPSADDGTAILTRYALLSGGAAFTVSEFGPLKKAADTIVAELKHQYRLGYDPPPGPPR